jgi:nitroreductase
MNIDDFLDLATKRRSVRSFKPDPVPDEYIEKVLEAARWAQSGSNAQSWEFIVIKSKDTRYKIAEIMARGWSINWDIEKTRIMEIRHQKYMSEEQGPQVEFRDAPVFIVLCEDPRPLQATALSTHFIPSDGGMNAHWFKNMANVTTIIHLAVAACGLGSQWVSVKSTSAAEIERLLGVPEELSIHTIVPIGYPLRQPPAGTRRELKEMVHYERYDPSKYRSGDDIFRFLIDLRKRIAPAYAQKK